MPGIGTYGSLNFVTRRLLHQEWQSAARTLAGRRLFSAERTPSSPASAEAAMMSVDLSPSVWLKLMRLPTGTSTTKLMLMGLALIFIYDYTVIYVCVNGGGQQLFSL